MKLRIITIINQLLILSTLLFLAGCGGSSGTTTSSGSSATGAITAKVVAAGAAQTASVQKADVATLPGVVTVRFTVSGSGMTGISKDFPVDNRRGTIENVPVGTGRVLSVQGLNASGAAIYAGSVSNITVAEGQTSDVGTVMLQPAPPINGFTASMISGKTFTWTSSQPSNGSITYNADGTYQNTSYSGTWADSGKWTINSAGVLILSNNGGTTDTVTLTSGSSSPMTATVKTTGGSTTNEFTVTFTESTSGGGTATGSSAYFPATVGNSWTYETTSSDSSPFTVTYSISQVSGSNFTLRFTHNFTDTTGSSTLNSDQNISILNGGYYVTSANTTSNGTSSGITFTSTSQTTYSAPGHMFLPPSMAVGASGSSSTTGSGTSTTTTTGSSSGSFTTTATTTDTFNYSITGTESVAVPAGTFLALKVNYTQTTTTTTTVPYSQTVTTNSSGTFWYVSGVGWVKSVDTTSGYSSTSVLKSYVIK